MAKYFKKPEDQIEGSVERVTFHSEESGFCVLRAKVRGHRELVTVIGKLPAIVAGEFISATGDWIVDKQHGRQFKADHIKNTPPSSLKGIEKFLSSGLIKGIGPKYAERLVEHFGKDVYDIMECNSAKLEEVEGIGKKRRLLIKESWNENKAIRAIMGFLIANGAGTSRAFRIYKIYGDSAIQKVQRDPYCLARDIRGIGFKIADKIADKIGIEKDSDLRARAGVEHVLLEITTEGHCATPRPTLLEKAQEILDIPEDIINNAIDYGVNTKRLTSKIIPEISIEPLIYLTKLYNAELQSAYILHDLQKTKHPCPKIDIEKAIAWCEEKTGLTFAAQQKISIEMAIENKLMIITGGPGVGKTTIVNGIIKILQAKKLKVILAAPTGRAAKRMSETTGHPAKTIHRLLEFDPHAGGFKKNQNSPLEGDIFIIDESSMLDISLAHNLLQAFPRHAAVIFVGDVDQLPSVGPGTVLKDMIESHNIPTCKLNEIFRQAANSDIVVNAHNIHKGKKLAAGSKDKESDFYFIEAEEPEKALQIIQQMVSKNIPQKFGVNPISDIQVLTPMRRGILGSQNINMTLQDILNPSKVQIEKFGFFYRINDKIMQLQNNYDKDVYNGDIGRIIKIDNIENEVTVDFDGRKLIYSFYELDEIEPCYAFTIHKSQGSEFPCVVIPIHTQHYIMLQRNLFYTAVTRGKKLVVLVGNQKGLNIAISRNDVSQRITTLKRWLSMSPKDLATIITKNTFQ
ncbi:MAG: ATP-dependent RecD-like DNA helicase [Kiritimatiellae bacterium]|jgi:exodeoxyribonuclease V alpha subunit|nr:ATP-dependent RecD-like DNA helicase [Kiritimatiellia bacterium]